MGEVGAARAAEVKVRALLTAAEARSTQQKRAHYAAYEQLGIAFKEKTASMQREADVLAAQVQHLQAELHGLASARAENEALIEQVNRFVDAQEERDTARRCTSSVSTVVSGVVSDARLRVLQDTLNESEALLSQHSTQPAGEAAAAQVAALKAALQNGAASAPDDTAWRAVDVLRAALHCAAAAQHTPPEKPTANDEDEEKGVAPSPSPPPKAGAPPPPVQSPEADLHSDCGGVSEEEGAGEEETQEEHSHRAPSPSPMPSPMPSPIPSPPRSQRSHPRAQSESPFLVRGREEEEEAEETSEGPDPQPRAALQQFPVNVRIAPQRAYAALHKEQHKYEVAPLLEYVCVFDNGFRVGNA